MSDLWLEYIYFHTPCVRTVKALARLRGCAGSPEPSLVAYVINTIISWAGSNINWAAPSEFGTYRLCEQRRFRRACASAQSRQNLRCSLIQAVSQEWVKRNLQTENQIPGPSEWLGMRSWNLSWRNARRHKFAWRGPIMNCFLYNLTCFACKPVRSYFDECQKKEI